jgi:hypothetical protein
VVDAACDLVVGIRGSGAFDGVHLERDLGGS